MYRSKAVSRTRTSLASTLFALLTSSFIAFGAALTATAQTPAIVFSQAHDGGGVNGYGGTAAHLAANSRGDVFFGINQNGSNSVGELPINGGGNLVALLTGMSQPYGGQGVYVDKSGNVYVADTGDAQVVYIPFVNGGYPTGIVYASIGNCSAFPVPATQTTTCKVPLSYPGNLGYYVQTGDLALDAAGNLYLLDKYTGGGDYGGVDVLIQVSAKTGNFNLISTTLGNDAFSEIAVSPAGDVFVTNYGSLYFFKANGDGTYAAGTTAPNMNGPNGVSADANGNIFVTQTGAQNIIEFPYVNGAYNLNSFSIVNNALKTDQSPYGQNGVAIDGYGDLTYDGGTYPNSYSQVNVGHIAFGSNPTGATTGTQTIHLFFNSAVTLGPIQATGPFAVASTTCTTGAQTVASNCSVNVTYTPTAAGNQLGQLIAYDNNQNILGTATLSGNGTAATLNTDPGTTATDGSGFTAPSAVATDNAGNVYVADSSTGSIYKTSTGSTTTTAIATGFKSPSAVAVDGTGNLYVADTGNAQIVEVPFDPATATYGTQSTLLTGLSGPSGLSFDSYGDLYVADSGNARVLRLASSGSQPLGSLITTIGSGWTTPVAVAVDNTNTNVYVADAGTGSIVQVGLDISSQASVLSGLTTPSGVTVDPAGNVYAVDSGKATITRLPYISGSINPNFKTTLASVVKLPAAIASDNLGNLYVADTTDAAVATDNRSTGLLTFGNLTVGDTSNTTAASISNGGTASFSLSTPYYTQSGATSSFAIQSSSTCAAGATLTTGESCTVAANFTPQSYGTLVDMLTLASTAPNAASIDLSGVGTPVLIKSTLTLAVTSSGTPTYPQPVTVTATLVPASQAASAPTGTVTFVVDNQAQPPVNLNSNGTASITLTGLTGGAHTITASYSGDYFYSYTTSSPLTVTLGQSTTTTTLAINAPDVNPTAANPGQAVSLIATVTPPASGTPTGTVTFYNGTTVLGTAPVQAASANKVSFGQATLTISTLALGQYEVTATYSGDVNYTGSSSTTPVPLLIANPTIAMVPSANKLLGDGAPITLSINSIAGYTGAVDFSCTGLPAYSACSFSPAYAQVSPTNNAPVLFSVVINQPPVIAVPAGMGASANLPGRPALAACITLCLLLPGLLFGLARRAGAKTIAGFSVMRLLSFIAFVLLTGGAVALSGCGNSSTASYLTPKGTSTITLSATVTVVNPNPPPSGPPDVVNPPPAVSIPIQLTVN